MQFKLFYVICLRLEISYKKYCMVNLRKFYLGIIAGFCIIFCAQQTVSLLSETSTRHLTNILIDFENSPESSEEQKYEDKKEFKITNLNAESLKNAYLSTCSEYGQLDIAHSLEVFLDIVTPPPQA